MDMDAKWNNISVPSHNRFWLKIRSSVKWCGNRYMRDENCLSLLIVHNSINKPTIVDVVKIVSRMAEQKKKKKKVFHQHQFNFLFMILCVFGGKVFMVLFRVSFYISMIWVLIEVLKEEEKRTWNWIFFLLLFIILFRGFQIFSFWKSFSFLKRSLKNAEISRDYGIRGILCGFLYGWMVEFSPEAIFVV